MIRANNDGVLVSGTIMELTSDLAHIVKGVYESLKSEAGEEFARETIALAGRLAFCETDEDFSEVRKEFVDGNII